MCFPYFSFRGEKNNVMLITTGDNKKNCDITYFIFNLDKSLLLNHREAFHLLYTTKAACYKTNLDELLGLLRVVDVLRGGRVADTTANSSWSSSTFSTLCAVAETSLDSAIRFSICSRIDLEFEKIAISQLEAFRYWNLPDNSYSPISQKVGNNSVGFLNNC